MVELGDSKALDPSDPNYFPPYKCHDQKKLKVVFFLIHS